MAALVPALVRIVKGISSTSGTGHHVSKATTNISKGFTGGVAASSTKRNVGIRSQADFLIVKDDRVLDLNAHSVGQSSSGDNAGSICGGSSSPSGGDEDVEICFISAFIVGSNISGGCELVVVDVVEEVCKLVQLLGVVSCFKQAACSFRANVTSCEADLGVERPREAAIGREVRDFGYRRAIRDLGRVEVERDHALAGIRLPGDEPLRRGGMRARDRKDFDLGFRDHGMSAGYDLVLATVRVTGI